MAEIPIPNLTPAITLNGTEELEIVQSGISKRTTTRAVANLKSFYGSFYDTTTQTNAGATSANPMLFNSTDYSSGVSAESLGKIRITDAGDDDVEIWLSVNGTNVPWSASVVSVHGNNGKAVAAWNFFYQFAANDYFQLLWHSVDTDMRILSRTTQISPTRPAIPSVILTVNLVG